MAKEHSHRDLCRLVAAWLLKKPGVDLVCWELGLAKRSVVDAIGLTTSPRYARKKVMIVEVKRTRSDLLQDLKKKKMLKYEALATHCYLAGTAEALRHKGKAKETVDALQKLGLPSRWGVILLPTNKNARTPTTLKRASSIRTTTTNRIHAITRKIAKSMVHRTLSSSSPLTERD